MIGEVAIGAGHDGVEQPGMVASRDDDPEGPPSQRRHLDGVCRPGQFSREHALDILLADSLGHHDHQIRGAPGEVGGVGLVGQPGAQAGSDPGRADPLRQNIGVEEVLLHELAESGGELILALTITAVCGIGRPSGRRKSAVTANQSATPPIMAASAPACT